MPVTRLGEINMLVTDDFVVHWVFDSLPLEYEQLKVSCTILQLSGVMI